jgi:hypothetical protein
MALMQLADLLFLRLLLPVLLHLLKNKRNAVVVSKM